MSNDSIPHWPIHDSPLVVRWLTAFPPSRTGIIELRRNRNCAIHPNNGQVPTKEKKDITLGRPHNLDHPEGLGLGHRDTTNLHNKPPIASHRTEPHSFPHGAGRTNADDYVSKDLGLRCNFGSSLPIGCGRIQNATALKKKSNGDTVYTFDRTVQPVCTVDLNAERRGLKYTVLYKWTHLRIQIRLD